MEPNNEIEIRSLIGDLHIESREAGTVSRTIVGYAAKFESWSEPIMGWFREKIARGAFDGCDLSDVIMCFNHNTDSILARTTSGTLRLEVDDVGLRHAYSPVSNEYREGVLVAAVAWAFVKRIPSEASLSTFGVFTFLAP